MPWYVPSLLSLVVRWLIDAYLMVLLIRMVVGWVVFLSPRFRPRGVIASLVEVVHRLTDPALRWIRRYVAPLRVGPLAFDIAFVVLYVALILVRTIVAVLL